jgi:hypothetical protein
MDWIERIVLFVMGGGLFTLITLRASKKKVNAEADSAVLRNRFDVVDFENKITERVVLRLEGDNLKKENKINELSETVEQMGVTIKIQAKNIEALHKEVNDYKETCDNCQFRLEKKKK